MNCPRRSNNSASTCATERGEVLEAPRGVTVNPRASAQKVEKPDAPGRWRLGRAIKFKTATDSNVSLIAAGTTVATRALLSVPVLVSNSIPDGAPWWCWTASRS